MAQSQILTLSQRISDCTKTIHDYLTEHQLPFPSFNAESSQPLPKELSKVQDELIEATDELNALILRPKEFLFRIGAHNNNVCLQAIARFNIAQNVPLNGDVSYQALASKLHLNENILRRVLGQAMSMRIFAERTKDMVSHTPASWVLTEPHMIGWLNTGTGELWPAATKVVDALSKWPESQEPNETGFALANGTTQALYQVLSTDPKRASNFASAMEAFASRDSMSLEYITSHSSWKNCTSAVDIGGSTGRAAVALATAHPSLNITVQDLHPAEDGSEDVIPTELRDRVKFMVFDFMAENAVQPIQGADVYLLRWILHNWSDKYGIQILRSLIPALKAGARVLIMEILMPEPGTIPFTKERDLRTFDMDMLALFNAEERSVARWKQLLQAADSRFHFVAATQPENSTLGILDIIWDPEHAS